MISVEVRNFQSIERASFQIKDFTLLVGRSNIGKSALVRAVQCALTGAPVGEFVRHGAACARKTKNQKTCRCHVSVSLKSDGFSLLWEKGDTINRYVYNGTEYPAAERGMPEFLAHNFKEIKVGERDVLLQVADQFHPIFLLDQSSTSVADVLSDMAKLDQVNLAIRLVEKDRREASSTRKVRDKDLVEAKTKLAAYVGLDAVVQDAHTVKEKFAGIRQQQKKGELIEGFVRSHQGLQAQVARLEGVSSLCPPDPFPLKQRRDVFLSLDRMCSRSEDQGVALEALRGVESIMIPELGGLRDQMKTSQRLSGWVSQLLAFRASFVHFKQVPTIDLPKDLPHGTFDQYKEIASLLDRLVVLSKRLTALEIDHKAASDEKKTVEDEWVALGVCSTCARPFHTDLHPSRV
jgi:hypothetical protein